VLAFASRHRTFVTAFAAAAVAQLCALIYYRAWVFHLDVPIDLTGDSLQKLQLVTAAVRDGWILHSSRIGLPGQGQHLDFPRYDSLNYAVIKVLAWCIGNGPAAANLYFLAGYGLIALTACWVLVRLGIAYSWSFVGGVAYAWLPYHQLRGFHHFTNSAYFFVPLSIWFVRSAWYPPPSATTYGWRRWAAWAVFGVALELQNPYYAIFFVVLSCSVAALLGAARGFRVSRTALIRTIFVVFVVALTFAVEQLPRWVFEAAHGKNVLAVVRPLNGPSEYALNIADLVNPSPDHPVPWLANFTQWAAGVRGIKTNERVVSTLPLIGLIGLVIGPLALLRRSKRLQPGNEAARLKQWAGALILVALAWCHEGAICTLMAECGIGLVRAWNRMSTYIAFAAIVAAVAFLDEVTARRSQRMRRWLAGGAFVLVMAEQLLAQPRSTFAASAARWDEAKRLTSELTEDGRLHRAFILPFIEYPEAGKIGTINDYDHFLLVVASDKMAISYGSMRGRGAHYFSSAAAQLHGAELPAFLREAGFDLLIVDTFSTATSDLRRELATVLGEPIAKTSRFLAYRIAPARAEAPTEATWRAYSLGDVINFRDVASRRFLELNFSVYEPEGTWSEGRLAALRMSTASLPNSLVLNVQGDLFEDPKRAQHVRVVFDGQPICVLDRSQSIEGVGHHWACPFSPTVASRAATTHEIRFEVARPVSPHMLKQSADPRLLGLRLVTLQLDAAE
jgi:phosphoglycerol transferase